MKPFEEISEAMRFEFTNELFVRGVYGKTIGECEVHHFRAAMLRALATLADHGIDVKRICEGEIALVAKAKEPAT